MYAMLLKQSCMYHYRYLLTDDTTNVKGTNLTNVGSSRICQLHRHT